MRGRPAGQMTPTRARVEHWWHDHGPAPIGKAVRMLGMDRSNLKRTLRSLSQMGRIDNFERANY